MSSKVFYGMVTVDVFDGELSVPAESTLVM